MLTDNHQIFRNCFVIIYCHRTKVSSQINKCIILKPNELSITLSNLWYNLLRVIFVGPRFKTDEMYSKHTYRQTEIKFYIHQRLAITEQTDVLLNFHNEFNCPTYTMFIYIQLIIENSWIDKYKYKWRNEVYFYKMM